MSTCRVSVRLASILALGLLLCDASHAEAQSPNPTRFTGEWTGTLVTDALRGSVTHTITGRTLRLSISTAVTARDRTLQGTGDSITVRGDTLRFGVTIDGNRLLWVAVLKQGMLTGSIKVHNGAELAASGVWEAVRKAPGAAASAEPVTPALVFAAAWGAIDRGYANFPAKRIDWAAVRALFASRAAIASSDSVLFGVLSDMLGLLNDTHVTLRKDSTWRSSSGSRAPTSMKDFSVDLIARRYAKQEMHTAMLGTIRFGWLADSIGYLYLSEFGRPREVESVLDSVFAQFRGAAGLVIDIRDNRGGNDVTGQKLLNRIADKRRLYLSTKARALSAHSSFLAPHAFYLDPAEVTPFRGPVIVLTNRRTVSAGENFLLGIRELPHVSIVGDVTTGGFSDVTRETLPNGWILGYPMNHVVDANGRSWEGVGVPPDYRRVNSPADVLAGKDAMLEFGMSLLITPHPR